MSRYEVYKAGRDRRAEAERVQREQRRERAWQVAQTAAKRLKNEFGATRVVVFGSLLEPARFHTRSDVDLAAWDIAAKDYFQAVYEITWMDAEIEVNLVDATHCRQVLLQEIENKGVVL